MSPLVTIVVPCYNHMNYVSQTIESIVNQRYKNIELIVIDDGSKDGSLEVLKKLQVVYNFKLVYRENRGLVNTLNEGLLLSKGKYFCAVASDDILFEDKIEQQVKFMEENSEYALCYGKMKIVDENNKFIKNLKSKASRSGRVFYELYAKNFITAPTVMIKRKILVELEGYSSEFLIEDYPLWLEIAKRYKIGFVDEYLVSYRIHGENMSSNMLTIIQETEKVLLKYNQDKKTDSILHKIYYRWFCDLSKTSFLKETEEYKNKSFKTSFYKLRYIRSVLRYNKKRKQFEK